MRNRLRAFATVAMAAGSLALSAGEVDLTSLVRGIMDLDALPTVTAGETCKQFSSYDRASRLGPNGEKIDWGANGDAGHYIRKEPNGEAVMAEMDGPGAVVQTWSANPQGKLHFYLDDAKEPIVFDFTAFTTGGIPEIPPPISTKGGGAGVNSYLPIPYAKRCVIKADKAHGQYYHFDYITFAPGTAVTTFRWPLSDGEKQAIREVAKWIETRSGEDPCPPRPGAQRANGVIAVDPGSTVTAVELQGPAVVTAIRAKIIEGGRKARRTVLVRAYFDGAEKPSVEAPFGDFFSSTWADVPFRSLPIGMTDGGVGYSYWRMPFKRSARFEIWNGDAGAVTVEGEVEFAPAPWKDDTTYFHAKWRREAPNVTFDWPYLRCEGRGRFVGVSMSVQNPDPPWFGEGDEKVYVDGEPFPSWFGTGTEDYFCDAWGFRPFIQFCHGCPMYHEPGKTTVYRWHLLDSIPFAKTFEMTIENYANNKDYSAVMYWYASPPNGDFFKTPTVAERLPWPMQIPGAVEAEAVAGEGASIVEETAFPFELSSGKAVKLAAGAPPLALAVPVGAPDAYRLIAFGPKGQQGAGLAIEIGGEPALQVAAPAFGKDGQVAAPKRVVLDTRTVKGTVGMRVAAAGGEAGAAVLLDALRLEPRRRVENAIEAEALAVTWSPRATGYPAYLLERDDVSGLGAISFTAPVPREWIAFQLPDKLRGTYQVVARIVKGPPGGVFDVAVGDAPGAGTVDAFAPATVLSPEIPIGTFELRGGDANIVRLTAEERADPSAGFAVGIDYFRLKRVAVEKAIEAESLKILRERDSSAQHQALGELWSGEVQLFCPGREGQFVDLELPVKDAGRYAVGIYFTKAGDYGIVEVELDGKSIGEKFNGFNNGIVPSGKIDFGTAELAAGNHVLSFRCRGKDPASSNCFMGIDCVTLAPAK